MLERTEDEALKQVAQAMVLAARTAPKGKGQDNLAIVILEREEIEQVIAKMEDLGQKYELPAFIRDAKTLKEHVKMALLLGTRISPLGLKYCGLCGFKNCGENKQSQGHCVFNTGDLGIAIGSAASVAAKCHADNRILYTMGMAALDLKLLGEEVKVAYGIALSATAKNPFFDR